MNGLNMTFEVVGLRKQLATEGAGKRLLFYRKTAKLLWSILYNDQTWCSTYAYEEKQCAAADYEDWGMFCHRCCTDETLNLSRKIEIFNGTRFIIRHMPSSDVRLWTHLIWTWRLVSWEKHLPHWGHSNGFSPAQSSSKQKLINDRNSNNELTFKRHLRIYKLLNYDYEWHRYESEVGRLVRMPCHIDYT